MTRPINRDVARFREILRGRVRENLRRYITQSEMLGRRGKDVVSIPVPNIEIPRFLHGQRGSGGVGQGEGDVGQPIGPGRSDGDGAGSAGSEPGREHFREVEVTLEELADMLAEELELPRIEPKGKEAIKSRKDKYNSIRRVGPDSLRHFKRTYRRALRRAVMAGEYDPARPRVLPTREDTVYRSWRSVEEPQTNAAILYLMDVSGSMTDEQKQIVRTEAFWIDTWLQSQYHGIEKRYIIHDAVASEVDEETFYHTRESGGTRISSAYKVALSVIQRDFPVEDWNIYCFQFSDGDNWGEDNGGCLRLLSESILPVVNVFCYGQVESPYGSGDFIRELRKLEKRHDNLVLSEIPDRDAIYDSIKAFLGKGK